jgi:hypothetical protein
MRRLSRVAFLLVLAAPAGAAPTDPVVRDEDAFHSLTFAPRRLEQARGLSEALPAETGARVRARLSRARALDERIQSIVRMRRPNVVTMLLEEALGEKGAAAVIASTAKNGDAAGDRRGPACG